VSGQRQQTLATSMRKEGSYSRGEEEHGCRCRTNDSSRKPSSFVVWECCETIADAMRASRETSSGAPIRLMNGSIQEAEMGVVEGWIDREMEDVER
jgi:hypothetical protein